jgi:hypothetical protein
MRRRIIGRRARKSRTAKRNLCERSSAIAGFARLFITNLPSKYVPTPVEGCRFHVKANVRMPFACASKITFKLHAMPLLTPESTPNRQIPAKIVHDDRKWKRVVCQPATIQNIQRYMCRMCRNDREGRRKQYEQNVVKRPRPIKIKMKWQQRNSRIRAALAVAEWVLEYILDALHALCGEASLLLVGDFRDNGHLAVVLFVEVRMADSTVPFFISTGFLLRRPIGLIKILESFFHAL